MKTLGWGSSNQILRFYKHQLHFLIRIASFASIFLAYSWQKYWILTFPASLSGRPESLSEDFPLARLSREWHEDASNKASYGLSSTPPGVKPDMSSLTCCSISPVETHTYTLQHLYSTGYNEHQRHVCVERETKKRCWERGIRMCQLQCGIHSHSCIY